VVYREDGIPIFTKYFSDFCSNLFKDSARLTTFLSTLETISEELSDEKSLRLIQISNFIMKRTVPSRHSIVLGIESKNDELFKALFQALTILLENKY